MFSDDLENLRSWIFNHDLEFFVFPGTTSKTFQRLGKANMTSPVETLRLPIQFIHFITFRKYREDRFQ